MTAKFLTSLGLAIVLLFGGSMFANAASTYGGGRGSYCSEHPNSPNCGGAHPLTIRQQHNDHAVRPNVSVNGNMNYGNRDKNWCRRHPCGPPQYRDHNWCRHHYCGPPQHHYYNWCRYHHCGNSFYFQFNYGYYPYYGYGGYPYGVSCRRAAQIVRNHGYRDVRTISCGRYYDRFSALWRGHRVRVKVRVANGAIARY